MRFDHNAGPLSPVRVGRVDRPAVAWAPPALPSTPAPPQRPPLLQARPLRHQDLAAAVDLLPAWLELAPELRAALPVLWTRLLGHSGFWAEVVEDLSQPPGARLVGLGAAVVLTPDWQERLRGQAPVQVAAAWYGDLLAGRTALPDDKALGRANASGQVGLLMLHDTPVGSAPAEPRDALLRHLSMRQFRQALAGWQLQAVWQEAPPEASLHLQCLGLRRRRPAGVGLPVLHGLSRDEARGCPPGLPAPDAFHPIRPVLGLSGSERRLLRLALADLTDEEIADEAGITLHTLKKLWRSACDRAVDALPDLFMPAGDALPGTRGPEKRRHLLHYLRQHPEELRPFG